MSFWLTGRQPLKHGTFRTLCRLVVSCGSIGEAIREGSRFYGLVTDDFAVHLRYEADEASLAVSDRLDRPEKRPQLQGTVLLFAYGLLCWLSGKAVPLRSVHHSFSCNRFSLELTKVYGVPIRYDACRSELRFSSDVLDWPVVPSDDEVSSFLAGIPSPLLTRIVDRPSCTDRIRSILRRRVQENLSLEAVASMLAMSPQTLRGRLVRRQHQWHRFEIVI